MTVIRFCKKKLVFNLFACSDDAEAEPKPNVVLRSSANDGLEGAPTREGSTPDAPSEKVRHSVPTSMILNYNVLVISLKWVE